MLLQKASQFPTMKYCKTRHSIRKARAVLETVQKLITFGIKSRFLLCSLHCWLSIIPLPKELENFAIIEDHRVEVPTEVSSKEKLVLITND